jgi:hypothetical protein
MVSEMRLHGQGTETRRGVGPPRRLRFLRESRLFPPDGITIL